MVSIQRIGDAEYQARKAAQSGGSVRQEPAAIETAGQQQVGGMAGVQGAGGEQGEGPIESEPQAGAAEMGSGGRARERSAQEGRGPYTHEDRMKGIRPPAGWEPPGPMRPEEAMKVLCWCPSRLCLCRARVCTCEGMCLHAIVACFCAWVDERVRSGHCR